MNKSSVLIFILELAIFIGFMLVYQTHFGLSQESRVFLIAIFSFSWLFRYQRSVMLLEYYTHVIMVLVLFIVIVVLVTLTLDRSSHVFIVGITTIISWFFIVCIARFAIIYAFGHPYKIIIHPDILDEVALNYKIKLITKAKVTENDLKEAQAIIINKKYPYQKDWEQLILHASQHDIPVLTVGTYEELIEQRLSLDQLNENWMYAGFSIPLWYRWFKGVIEFLFALVLLPLLLLIFIVVTVIILITMGRPILYTQYRMGLNNRPFKVYKFRSMIQNADREGETEDADQRITAFGQLIRKFRIDELPQFINILKGDMSLIGPRPEWIETAQQFEKDIPLYRLRHIIKPGITGWAQVTQGHAIGAEGNFKKLQYDLYYVKHYSLIMDLRIVLKTIYIIITGFGAK
ncbi:MAG: sugar transferase [Gammaproteobacteria bacterium]|nr:MAG: sugar transferase [Gammaproteobacteria bacterium]UTW42503.1 sugar transferase [bacterium SCSIO 12844]